MIASEIVFGALFMLLCAFLFAMTFRFPHLTIALSPTVYPRFVTVCLFLLSSLLLGQGIHKQLSGQVEKRKSGINRVYLLRFILLAAAGFLYTRIVRYAGYLHHLYEQMDPPAVHRGGHAAVRREEVVPDRSGFGNHNRCPVQRVPDDLPGAIAALQPVVEGG